MADGVDGVQTCVVKSYYCSTRTASGRARNSRNLAQILWPIPVEPQSTHLIADYKFGILQVSPAAFAHLANLVQPLASGKVVALLEGGYCLTSLAEAASLTVKTFLGDPCPRLPSALGAPRKEMADAIRNARVALRPFWKCFQVGEN